MSIIAHNLLSMNAQRQFGINSKAKAKSAEKLSSGLRINRSADDAAGLAISEKMRRQIRGLTQGVENSQNGVSLCQVADGALAQVDEMLHRITELAVKSANGTNSEEDRGYIQREIQEILAEIDRIGEATMFGERPVFQGTDEIISGGQATPGTGAATMHLDEWSAWIQSGTEAGSGLNVTIGEMDTDVLGIRGLDVSTVDGAKSALEAVKGALHEINDLRTTIGAQQNRLEHVISSENNIVENTTAAESRIRDTDMAKEMVKFANDSILEQVGHAMISQANQSSQGVLNLLN